MNVYYKTPLALMIGLAFTSSLHAEDIYTFDEVIVSATQSEQQEKDVAASVSQVGREQLDDDLAQNLNQLFQLTADRCLTKAEQVMNHVNLTLSSSLNNKHDLSAADLPAQELVEGVR